MTVTINHLTKFLQGKMKKGVHGSVLIHFKDGEVSGVTDQSTYNNEAFIKQLSIPVKRYTIKTKQEIEEQTEAELLKTDGKVSLIVETDNIVEKIIDKKVIKKEDDLK